ncbi:MAG: 30S ribosomal protein S1 [Chloroflexi bacterium]|jgi:small subunit ribosomal protein S1|nr:30S ribosomal protein S1 [Chloroflexota bacterium]|tara:strand:- start:4083 stop:5474 length:1392 start_codon:yes stop_codon:yes gene_type:complete
MPPETQDNSPQDMQQLLEEMDFKILRRGEVVEGSIMRVDSDGIFLDIGHKEEGFVPMGEMKTINREELAKLAEGDSLIAFVMRPDSQDGPILSVDRARGEEGWREIQKFMEQDQPVEGVIVGFNRGGCILEVANVQGFVPMSQLITISRDVFKQDSSESGEPRSDDSIGKDLVGNTLTVKVLEVNRSRNRAIFSERSALQEQRDEQKAVLIEKLEEGEVRKGVVTGISNFGAFVDLGGADGLIHISEMSWSMVESPEDLVKVGEELDVYVLRIDRETMKIALSLRRLQPEPWETIFERYQVGDVVDATVTKIANFGAFARLEDSIEGLIHITELSDAVITNPNEVVSEGQEIKVKILKIEMDRKRLGLSLKQTVEGLDSAGYVSEAPLESDSIGVDTEDPDGEEDGNSLAASAATTEAEETVEVEEIETEVSGVAEVDTDATDEGQDDEGQDELEDPPIEKEE